MHLAWFYRLACRLAFVGYLLVWAERSYYRRAYQILLQVEEHFLNYYCLVHLYQLNLNFSNNNYSIILP